MKMRKKKKTMQDFEQANFTPRRKIQFPSEIKQKGLHGSVQRGVIVRTLICAHMADARLLLLFRLFRDPDRTDAAKEKENLDREKERSEAQMFGFFCAEARWQIAGAGR